MAVRFLLSVLSRPLCWENRHLLCFALTRVPPKVTLLSWCLRLRLLFLPLASVGLRPLRAVRSNTAGMQGGRDSLGRASCLGAVGVDWLGEDSAPKTYSSLCVRAVSADWFLRGFAPKTNAFFIFAMASIVCCVVGLKSNPVFLLVSHPISWLSPSCSILRVFSRCAAVSCCAVSAALCQLNDTLSSCRTASTAQLGSSRGLPCCSGCGDFEEGSGGGDSYGDCSVVCSWGVFPDSVPRSTSGDSCASCGVGGCAAPNAKTFLGASLILLVFAAPQGI